VNDLTGKSIKRKYVILKRMPEFLATFTILLDIMIYPD